MGAHRLENFDQIDRSRSIDRDRSGERPMFDPAIGRSDRSGFWWTKNHLVAPPGDFWSTDVILFF